MSAVVYHDPETLLKVQEDDDILRENNFRWVMFPIKYKTFWNYYKEAEMLFWTAEDFNFDKDTAFLEKIDKNMLVKLFELICFYSIKDLRLYEDQAIFTSKMLDEIQIPEGRAFYGFQMSMENIHDEVYASILEVYIPDAKNKAVIINKVLQLDCVLNKKKWLTEIFENNIPFYSKLILLYISKVLFNGTLNILIGFCKQNKLLPGLCAVHEKIHRDEYLHGDFSVMCCNHLNNKLKYEHALDYVKMAVKLEYEFALEMLELSILKITKEDVKSFLEYLADTILVNLNYPAHFSSKYPFTWPEFRKLVVNEETKDESVKKNEDVYGEKQITFDEDF